MVSVPNSHVLAMMMSEPSFTTKFEELIITADSNAELAGAVWIAQSFKANTAHTISGVKLMLFHDGTPGILTVSIQALSGGDPDGTDLTVATLDESVLPTTALGELTEIALPPVALALDSLNAIVLRSTSSAGMKWEADGSSPAYADGNKERSTDSGAAWTAATGVDQMFEDWGFVP